MPSAQRKVGVGIYLDGAQEFKNALSDISKGNQVLNSEMKKLQAQFKGNTESTEFLTKKGELLQQQLYGQQEKVELLRKRLIEVARAKGEDAQETMELKIQLNNAETAEINLTHSIEENNTALENSGQKMVTVGDLADQLAGKLGIKLPEGAKKALDGMNVMSAGSVAALTAITAAVAVTVKALKGLMDLTIEAAHNADELLTESMVTGISVYELQVNQKISELADVSSDTINTATQKMTQSMKKARDGNAELIQTFQDLGVSIYDASGNLRDADDVMWDVLDALREVDNETERNILTTELMGKSAQELNPLILMNRDAYQELRKEVEENYVLSGEQVTALAEVDDAYQRQQLTVQHFKETIAAEFAPAAVSAMELFTNAVKVAGQMLTESHIVENLAHVIQGISGILEVGTQMIGALPSWMNPLNQISVAFKGLALVLAAVADTMKILVGLTPAFWGSGMLKEGLGISGFNNVQTVLGYGGSGSAVSYSNLDSSLGYDAASGKYYNLSTGNYVNAPGTDYWRGGVTWVGENGPELVSLPRGSSIMSASESAGAMGGQYITINVQGIEQLDEIVRWYESRRVTERMR